MTEHFALLLVLLISTHLLVQSLSVGIAIFVTGLMIIHRWIKDNNQNDSDNNKPHKRKQRTHISIDKLFNRCDCSEQKDDIILNTKITYAKNVLFY